MLREADPRRHWRTNQARSQDETARGHRATFARSHAPNQSVNVTKKSHGFEMRRSSSSSTGCRRRSADNADGYDYGRCHSYPPRQIDDYANRRIPI